MFEWFVELWNAFMTWIFSLFGMDYNAPHEPSHQEPVHEKNVTFDDTAQEIPPQ